MTRATTGMAVLAVLALLCGGPAAAVSGAAVSDPAPSRAEVAGPDGPGDPSAGSGLATQPAVDPDDVRLHVAVRPDGTAEWTVRYRVRLDNESRVEGFESLRADVESDPERYRSEFVDVVSPSVARAAEETGREMALRNASVSTAREPLAGVVTYRFEWTNFAAGEGERLRVGDALAGFYVDERSTLRIEWPGRYDAESVTPPPDDRSGDAATWHGPTDFGDDEPRVELAPAGRDLPLHLVAGAAVLVAATLGVVGLVRSGVGRSVVLDRTGATNEPDGSVGADESDGGAGAAPSGEAAGAGDSIPMELLSNEERVVAVLEASGGRMKQQAIAEELEWDDSKTSRVVSELREADAVEVFRIGRENVVTLPEEELL